MAFDVKIYRQTFLKLDRNNSILPVPLHIFETLPSTNQKLWELIDKGATIPLAVIALRQTAGKGQWGKQWLSPSGECIFRWQYHLVFPRTIVSTWLWLLFMGLPQLYVATTY